MRGQRHWPQVQASVLLQVRALCALATVQALVGTHTCMGQLVAAGRLAREARSLATGVALEGLSPGVRPEMVAHGPSLKPLPQTPHPSCRRGLSGRRCAGRAWCRQKDLGALRAGQLGKGGGEGLGEGSAGAREAAADATRGGAADGGAPTLACMSAPVVEKLGHVAECFATAAVMQWAGSMGPPDGPPKCEPVAGAFTAAVHAEVA